MHPTRTACKQKLCVGVGIGYGLSKILIGRDQQGQRENRGEGMHQGNHWSESKTTIARKNGSPVAWGMAISAMARYNREAVTSEDM